MEANTKSVTPVKQAETTLNQPASYSSIRRFSGRALRVFSIALGLLLVAGGQLQAADQFNSQRETIMDSRWLPWMGSWRLVSHTVNATDRDLEGEHLLKISPGKRETAVTVQAFQDETLLFGDAIVADGADTSEQQDRRTVAVLRTFPTGADVMAVTLW